MSKRASRVLWGTLVVLLVVYLLFRPAGPESGRNRINANVDPIGSLVGLSDNLQRAFDPADAYQAIPHARPGDWLAQHDESGQSYERYTMSSPNRPDATRSKIYLQPLGLFSDETKQHLNLLLEYVEVYF